MSYYVGLASALLYALGGLVCTRLTAGHLAYLWWENAGQHPWDAWNGEQRSVRPSGAQWLFAICVGLLLGIVWPTVLLMTSVQLPKVGAERQHDLKLREQRIKQAERELGIDR